MQQVIEIKKTEDADKEIWVVFDMDIQRDNAVRLKQDFENAINLSIANGIKVACANDAFELWFLLHYMYFENEWTRHEYYTKLSELWGLNYEKSCKKLAFCKGIYKLLANDIQADQDAAIRHATKLSAEQKDKNVAEKNPYTTIQELVVELNKYI